MRILKTGLGYFAIVFAVGFVLGLARVLLAVPWLGVRAAELAELPLMIGASWLAARHCMRRFGPSRAGVRLGVGLFALLLLILAELALATFSGSGLGQYIKERDPVSGSAYLVSLVLFALMPLMATRRQAESPDLLDEAQKPRRHSIL